MDIYKTIVRLTDGAVPFILSSMQADQNLPGFGGKVIREKGFAEPGDTGQAACTLLGAYFCGDSLWHKNAALLDAAVSMLSFLNEACHEDGSIDLLETNFHDCTSSGFAVQHVAYTYRLLEREAKTPDELKAKALARAFLEKSARAMITGGFHTPNHRWVVASALSLCFRCLGGAECLKMAETYLSEGIDCNAEGDFTERSSGIYDAVNNESLTIIAQELGKPELYDAVDRNLTKNLYYVEPDMTGFTLASRRQDYGTEMQMIRHFYTYYQAALRTGSGRFAWMAGRLAEQMEKLRVSVGSPYDIGVSQNHQNLLTRFLLAPEQELPPCDPPPDHYDRWFKGAGVVRRREGNRTCSLVRDNSVFMKFQNGNLKMYVKLACTFFQYGRLLAQEIAPIEGGYRLAYEHERGYTRPLPGIGEPDWWKIDHKSREGANMQKLRWQTDVIFREKGITMRILTEGTPGIPAKLECVLPAGGLLKTAGVTMPALPGGWAIAGETVTYDLGGDAIRISGGFNGHNYAVNMRNSDPQPTGQFCIYCTGFTPLNRELEIDAL